MPQEPTPSRRPYQSIPPFAPKTGSPAVTRIPAGAARRTLSRLLKIPVSRATFYRWLDSGLLPATKIVGHWWIDHRDLLRFAQDQEAA